MSLEVALQNQAKAPLQGNKGKKWVANTAILCGENTILQWNQSCTFPTSTNPFNKSWK